MFQRPKDIRISFHANERLHDRNITREEMINCVMKGRIRPDGHRIDDMYVYSAEKLEVIVAHRKDGGADLVSAIRKVW